MKIQKLILVAMSLAALVGCESTPETSSIAVRVGLTREQLKARFGEPLRIEPVASGGEDWFYKFLAWQARPSGETGVAVGTGGTESYVSATVEASKEAEERPIHISPDGYVIEPIPAGKIVKE